MAEEVTEQPATPPSAPTSAERLISEYELDTEPTEHDEPLAMATPEVEAPAQPAVPSERERGPDGRYLPKPHSRAMLRMAADLGISQEDIDAADPEQLAQTVYYLNRQHISAAREAAAQRTLGGNAPPGSIGQDSVSGPTPQPTSETAADDFGFSQLEEEHYDPALFGVIKALAGEVKRLRGLEQHVQSISQREQMREQLSLREQIDAAFADLGPEFHAVFGDKGADGLQASDLEYQRRMSVLNSLKLSPIKGGNPRANVAKRAKELFGSMAAPAAADGNYGPSPGTKRLTREQQEWNAGATARPTHRAGAAEPNGEQKALKTAARFMREQGLADEADLPPDSFLE